MSVTEPQSSLPALHERTAEDVTAILLVDDDKRNLLALESILDSPEHRLVTATTADQALLALMQEDYAAIVLDVQMPDLSGIELARLIKQRKRTQHIPILFLTAHYRESEHAVLGYGAGAVDYLTKPVHPAVLRSKVGVFVDLFRKTRALTALNRTMEAEIAERKTAEERFRVVLEAVPNAMLVFSPAGEVVLVNSEAEALYGWSRADLLRKDLRELLPPELIPPFVTAGTPQIVAAGTSLAQAATIRAAGDKLIPVEVTFTPIQSGEGIRLLALIVDVTERKQAEEALRAANAELEAKNVALERQAAERSLRLRAEAARAEAEAANAAKDRFLAMLSHELRTPLSPVLHAVSWLDEHPDCSKEVREMLQIIRRNVQLEARLIDDLLDLARVRNGKLQLQFQPLDAHAVLQHALEICQHQIDHQQLRLETRLDASHTHLRADPARLQQIFWNLISNATKFTGEGGTITITTRNDPDEDTLCVEISDTGIGLEPTRLARIFDAFEQASTQAASGLGLGLAICKALIEFHGGTISAHSAGLGLGSTFLIHLPILAAGQPLAPEGRPEAPAQVHEEDFSLRLLLVEDHHDTAAVLTRLLRRSGYRVETANSFASALKLAESYEFDVLISDIGLTDGNGVDLFGKLRSRPGYESLRGIAVSGFGMDDDIARSKAAGFAEHLTKPIDFSLLQRSLSTLAASKSGGLENPPAVAK
jgi:PAS domain S-box-containing protein